MKPYFGDEAARDMAAVQFVESIEAVDPESATGRAMYHAYCAGWIAGRAWERSECPPEPEHPHPSWTAQERNPTIR